MAIPTPIRHYLANLPGPFKVRQVPPRGDAVMTAEAAGIPLARLAKTVLVRAGTARLLLVLPADQALDLSALEERFQRRFEPSDAADIAETVPECDAGHLPPLGEPYGLRTVLDTALLDRDWLYFPSGAAGVYIRADAQAFQNAVGDAWRLRISRQIEPGSEVRSVDPEERRRAFKRKLAAVDRLPAMPGIAMELLSLRSNPYVNARDVATVIEQDPSLAAQLIRYAGSPLYAYQGKLESVEQAIARVIGVELTLDITLGLALGRSLQIPRPGPLGLDAFWTHALYCAALAQGLCNTIDYMRRPPPGFGYLAGLLHNFGILLLGHLSPRAHLRMNRGVLADRDTPLIEQERQILGVTHAELGSWLMKSWKMPEEIVEAVAHHHEPDYRGTHAVYANLVCVANRLLYRYDIGDASTGEIPAELLERLGLDEEKLQIALDSVLQDPDTLAFMARKMAA